MTKAIFWGGPYLQFLLLPMVSDDHFTRGSCFLCSRNGNKTWDIIRETVKPWTC